MSAPILSALSTPPPGLIVVERAKRIVVASQAFLIEGEERELAWAEKLVKPNVLYAWVLGRLVGAGELNQNGHMFDADELRAQAHTLVHAPMNMLHRPHQILGAYVGAELVYPTDGAPSAVAALGEATPANPFIESLAAFWRYYWPDEYAMVKLAHDAGQLAQSMECIPRTVTCLTGGCERTYEYAGRVSESYCEHLQTGHAPPRKLNMPHFSAGAVVLPPARPAWREAKVSELMAATSDDDLSDLYDQVAAAFPHLDPTDWESTMAQLLAMVPVEAPSRRSRPQPAAAADGDVASTAAMVALYPPPEVARAVAIDGGLAPDELHITLAYLGANATEELDRDVLEAVLEAFANDHDPLEGAVSGLGRFVAGYPAGQDPWPLYASIDVPDLPEFRHHLVELLEDTGTPVASNHGFTPHMTLTYVASPEEEAAAAQLLARGIAPTPLSFSQIVLAWGDERIPFDLAGEDADDPVAAMVELARAEAEGILLWRPEVARSFSAEKIRQMVKKGWAMADGRYPIENVGDLRNAIRLRNNGKGDKSKIRAHIVKRGRALGATDLLKQAGLV